MKLPEGADSPKPIEELGKRFGRLVVLGPDAGRYNDANGYKLVCLCDCGNTTVVRKTNLRRGVTKSCGCLQHEIVVELQRRNKKHGMTNTRQFKIWDAMHYRCNCPTAQGYARYGGRGITVCDEWREFLPFYEWAMTNGYRDNLTLDRIDNDGPYAPWNCRWATNKQQCNNMSTNVYLTHNGKTQTVTEWAEELGIDRQALYSRVKSGYTGDKLFSTTRLRPGIAGKRYGMILMCDLDGRVIRKFNTTKEASEYFGRNEPSKVSNAYLRGDGILWGYLWKREGVTKDGNLLFGQRGDDANAS